MTTFLEQSGGTYTTSHYIHFIFQLHSFIATELKIKENLNSQDSKTQPAPSSRVASPQNIYNVCVVCVFNRKMQL